MTPRRNEVEEDDNGNGPGEDEDDQLQGGNLPSQAPALDETSALLNLYKPSPNSTNRPSLTNLLEYGTLPQERGEEMGEEPLIQMHMHNNNVSNLMHQHPSLSNLSHQSLFSQSQFGDDEWPQITKKKYRKEFICTLFVLGAVFIVITTGVSCWGAKSYGGPHTVGPPSSSSSSSDSDPAASDPTQPTNSITNSFHARPYSHNHPVHDLHLDAFTRPDWSAPNPELFDSHNHHGPLPTNSWYQNLLLARHDEPTDEQRVYPVPYLVDTVGPIPGIRLHPTSLVATALVVQLTQVEQYGLTLGAASQRMLSGTMEQPTAVSKKYKVTHMTPLGVTLEWPNPTASSSSSSSSESTSTLTHSTSIVKGMPFATMTYTKTNKDTSAKQSDDEMIPTIAAEVPISQPPLLDGKTKLQCNNNNNDDDKLDSSSLLVQREVELQFRDSDYTWLVFVSRPVQVHCVDGGSGSVPFALQFDHDDDEDLLVVRIAMVNACTTGVNPTNCDPRKTQGTNPKAYAELLRQHANYYPGPNTAVGFGFHDNDNDNHDTTNTIQFDWDVQTMWHAEEEDDGGGGNLLMFALPHHQDLMMLQEATQEDALFAHYDDEKKKVCATSLLGSACLVQGSKWTMHEQRRWISFRAPRPPRNDALPLLAKAYREDLNYELPLYFQRGAGDTYFSGKMLAKLGRILTIGEELHEICSAPRNVRPKECRGLDIPSPQQPEFRQALARLRSSVEVWINGTAATPFVYDGMWGGIASCGCSFDESQGQCRNRYPDCPGFFNAGLNFGMAFYNDHHFHLGYHIYSAAIVAHFDPQWGRDHFEQVLLLVRDIANPSHDDKSFPLFRNKDWYQGSSWASGIAVSPLNGRNQESSSEAIAAYEGVALYGREMAKAWQGYDEEKAATAGEIGRYGEVLSASEVRSADRYWHIVESSRERQFPVEYTPQVVGILWTTMAQFQTWFGNAAYLAYGIQLLPLTAAAESRDSIDWARQLYQPFADSCDAHLDDCRDGGWSVLVLAILATVGHHEEAIQKAMELPSSGFTSAGGNGHSLTNTLWYLSTRPLVDNPLDIVNPNTDETTDLEQHMHAQGASPDNDVNGQPAGEGSSAQVTPNLDCGCNATCDATAFNQFALGHSCGSRIAWLIREKEHNEWDACHQVGVEFPDECGACDPARCIAMNKTTSHSARCPPCSKKVCGDSKLNRCPVQSAPYLCTGGASTGGCSPSPWVLHHDGVCESCCELSSGC